MYVPKKRQQGEGRGSKIDNFGMTSFIVSPHRASQFLQLTWNEFLGQSAL